MELIPREIEVLTTIVEDYIFTAQPVGSRTVSKHSRLGLSPASIRNTMSDLTEKGYLEQPYTSSGRIPTQMGFRFYLNKMLRITPLSEKEKEAIATYLGDPGLEVSDILARAAKLLSSLSQKISMVCAPKEQFSRWRQVDFVPVKPGLILAILVVEGGGIRSRTVRTDPDLTAEDLIKFGNYLNHLFQGRTLGEVRMRLLREIQGAEMELDAICRKALGLAGEAFRNEASVEVYIEGASNIVDVPEFADLSVMRDLLGLIEERSRLLDLLDRSISDGGETGVLLGEEALSSEFKECGMVSSAYQSGDDNQGVVGVIGPLRMDYAKILPLVDFTAKTITEMLKNRY